MKDNFRTAVEFANSIKRLRNKHILQIVLFGSVARGEDTPTSDIDIAVIHDLKDTEKLKTQIHKFQPERIQTAFLNLNQLAEEPELISALTGDGILLHGQPIKVRLKTKEVKPKVLLIYDTSAISKAERMKLNRALHGGISKSRYKNKEYITKTRGVLEERGVQKLTKAVVLAEPKKAAKLISTLKLYKVNWKEILVWV